MEYLAELKKIKKEQDVYVVGGLIRDYFLDKENKDVDLIVMSGLNKYVKDFFEACGKKKLLLDDKRQIYRVVTKRNIFIDFSNPVGQDILNDLGHRDFTINSMAIELDHIVLKDGNYYLKKDKIIDPHGALLDLQRKKIRMVDRTFVKDDPLRILRAYRFSITLGFKIENKTATIIDKNLYLLKHVKNERIKEELIKIFNDKINIESLNNFLKSGLINLLFNIETYQDKNNLDMLLKQNNYLCKKNIFANKYIKNYLFYLLLLYLQPIIKGDIACEEAGNILKKYTFSKKDVEVFIKYLKIAKLIFNDINLYVNNRELIYEHLFDQEVYFDDIQYLLCSYLINCEGKVNLQEKVVCIIDELKLMKKRIDKKAINGDQLIKILNIKEGRKVGEILTQIKKQKALKKIETKKEIIEFIKKNFKKSNKN